MDSKTVDVHLVDGDGVFIASKEGVSAMLGQADGSASNDHKYSVVSIMGVQSSGKSTLLNLLFGTGFTEMNAQAGRQQTTLGVWMDTSRTIADTFVMDLEGTDSGERGEDRTTFERQTTLYALALAEVLLINMWEQDIGRYTGANYGILKTVFEVNLQLFGSTEKTVIMFVIRDHIEEQTPAETLYQKLLKDVQNIWDEIEKPANFKDSKMSDFFSFEFAALPHKILKNEEFVASTTALQNRFKDADASDYVYGTDFHQAKSVPRDGFYHYASQVWQTIQESKELNLPSQKEMLSSFRCDEIASAAFSQFSDDMKELKYRAANSFCDDFGQVANNHVTTMLATYDEDAKRYLPLVAQRKREELFRRAIDDLFPVFDRQISMVFETSVTIFSDVCAAEFPTKGVTSNFNKAIGLAWAAAEKNFLQHFSELLIDGSGWDEDEYARKFKMELHKCKADMRKEQLHRVSKKLTRLAKEGVVKSASEILDDVRIDFWPTLRKNAVISHANLVSKLNKILQSFDCSDEEMLDWRRIAWDMIYDLLLDLAKQHASMLNFKLRRRFDRTFRYDEDGIHRRWSNVPDVRALFVKSRDDALQLLDLYTTFRLERTLPGDRNSAAESKANDSDSDDDDDDDNSNPKHPELLDALSRERVRQQFLLEIEGALREAEAEKESAFSWSKMPMWLVTSICILGFNEFVWVLSNPFMMMFLFTGGAALFAIYYLDMGGPARFIVKNAVKSAAALMSTSLQNVAERVNAEVTPVQAASANRQVESRHQIRESNSFAISAPNLLADTIHASSPASASKKKSTPTTRRRRRAD
jgi:protein SEY1